jgi:large subunit ribosomal protein L13
MIKATHMLNAQEVSRAWHLIDAEGQVLGRLASQVATILRGKHKPTFTPHVDTGDCVVVVNAAKIRLTGDKLNQKMYYRHSGYRGGLKATLARHLMEKEPEEIIRKAVIGMLPKTPLGHTMIKKLHVYAGPTHRHQAQGPAARALRWTAKAS